MTAYGFVLFLHVFFVLISFGAAFVVHVTLLEMRTSNDTAELVVGAKRLATLELIFPISAVLFFLAGVYLVQEAWEWGTGWILWSIAALVIMEGLGGTVLKKATKALEERVKAAPRGPVSPELRAAVLDRANWITLHFLTGLSLGVVYLMTVKPSGVACAIALILFSVAGAASALPFVKPPQTSPA